MASGLTESLARRCATLQFSDLPPEVVDTARLCILDWLGVTLAGSTESGPTILLDLQTPVAKDGVRVIGHPDIRLSARDAALVNGTSSHVLDFDDVNTVAHLVAMAALQGSTTVIHDADAHDSEVIALRDKVTVVGDGGSGAPTRVEIITTDGTRLSTAHDVTTPDADTVRMRDRVRAKFRAVAAPVLGDQRVEAAIATVDSLHQDGDLSRLLEAISLRTTGHARSQADCPR
jgi:2-methylcitrate dehydratase PrpD